MIPPIDWLLDGPSFVRYRARRDLLGLPEDDPLVVGDRQAMLADPLVQALIEELKGWPGPIVNSHKSAGQHFHKLTFLADLGLRATDPGVGEVLERVRGLRSPEGPFALRMSIGPAYGGSGREEAAWALCDAPLILYALARFGIRDEDVEAAASSLLALGRADWERGLLGWPCAVSASLGSWRGPGRKDDPCPFATLAMLKATAVVPAWRDSLVSRAGVETLLALWADSRSRHPYIFYMGTDFRKLKAPFIWYDLLHVLEVLTRFPQIYGDPRLHEMLALLVGKADPEGRYTAESVWQAWSAWESGQKKAPSRWLTLLAHRIRERVSAGERNGGQAG